MITDRRSLIKGLMALPLGQLQSKPTKWSASTVKAPFYILIHGLMFMEYGSRDSLNRDLLKIKAPYIPGKSPGAPGHVLYCGQLGSISQCTDPAIDWTSTTLEGSYVGSNSPVCSTIPADVDEKIPQFSRTTTGVGDLVDTKIKHVITLLWPQRFYAIRLNATPRYVSDFPSNPNQPVFQSISRCSGSITNQLGLVTVLQYSQNIPVGAGVPKACAGKYHYFFQNGNPVGDPTDINDHLDHVKAAFSNPQAFDLKVYKDDVGIKAGWQITGLPDCIDVTDEYSYGESTCFEELTALYVRELQLLDARVPKEQLEAIRQKRRHKEEDECPRIVSSANCPNFYLGL